MTMPTYIDLFGSEALAVEYYRALFPNATESDEEIATAINTSFYKIEPVFGEFRNYYILEDTPRNEHIKRAVCFEANSILLGGNAELNTGVADTQTIANEKVEDVSITYADGVSGAGIGDSSLAKVLGLLSTESAVLLSRYIRKTYGMGIPCNATA